MLKNCVLFVSVDTEKYVFYFFINPKVIQTCHPEWKAIYLKPYLAGSAAKFRKTFRLKLVHSLFQNKGKVTVQTKWTEICLA